MLAWFYSAPFVNEPYAEIISTPAWKGWGNKNATTYTVRVYCIIIIQVSDFSCLLIHAHYEFFFTDQKKSMLFYIICLKH